MVHANRVVGRSDNEIKSGIKMIVKLVPKRTRIFAGKCGIRFRVTFEKPSTRSRIPTIIVPSDDNNTTSAMRLYTRWTCESIVRKLARPRS